LFVGLVCSNFVSFEGEKVLRINVKSQQQLDKLSQLLGIERDVWSRDGELAIGENDVRTNSTMEQSIKELGLSYQIMINDVEQLIQKEREYHNNRSVDEDFFSDYHDYDDIVQYLQDLQATYPNLVTYNPSIGKTIQGRDIPAIRITGSKHTNPKSFWFNGGQHAREWVSPATVLYLATQLASQYGKDGQVTKILNEIAVDIVPIVNPDGYHYSWTSNRLWRKNRRNNGDGSFGVDLNRNWNEHWGGQGSSGVPSSDTYRGKSAFSEPETTAVSNYISSIEHIIGAIDFHSYSQLVLRPYGWSKSNCPDEEALRIIGDGVSYTIDEVYSKYYKSQKAIDLYITTGTASDWFYQEGIWAAYTIELRDTGQYGFVLPASQIIPTAEEIWNSMIYFMLTVVDSHPGR